jgi:hypothetical protein
MITIAVEPGTWNASKAAAAGQHAGGHKLAASHCLSACLQVPPMLAATWQALGRWASAACCLLQACRCRAQVSADSSELPNVLWAARLPPPMSASTACLPAWCTPQSHMQAGI